MAYMTMNEMTGRRPRRNLSGLGVEWSGHDRGDYDPATGVPMGYTEGPGMMSESDKVDFLAEQARAGLSWNGSAWVSTTALLSTAVPATSLLSTAVPAPATIYIDPATGQTVGAPAFYYPPQVTPPSAPTYYPPQTQPAYYPPQSSAPPPQTIIPAEMAASAPSGIAAVPTAAWIAGAALLGLGLFILIRK